MLDSLTFDEILGLLKVLPYQTNLIMCVICFNTIYALSLTGVQVPFIFINKA